MPSDALWADVMVAAARRWADVLVVVLVGVWATTHGFTKQVRVLVVWADVLVCVLVGVWADVFVCVLVVWANVLVCVLSCVCWCATATPPLLCAATPVVHCSVGCSWRALAPEPSPGPLSVADAMRK